MHECWLYLEEQLVNKTLNWEKRIELPFAPFVGMTLQFGIDDDPECGPGFTPHDIVYLVKDRVWCLYDQWLKDCSCKLGDGCCEDTPEGRSFFENAGWTLGWVELRSEPSRSVRRGIVKP